MTFEAQAFDAPAFDMQTSGSPNFESRHIGPSPAEQERMLAATGHASLDELTQAALPPGIGDPRPLSLPPALSEAEALAELRRLAGRNTVTRSMIGLGYYGTHTPAVIRRNVLENPAWYTAYTPYQPEISQGRLEALLTFQTLVEDLTALPVAGASLLDEATAAAEAMTLARRSARRGRIFLADADCLPQTLAVLATRAEPLGIELVVAPVTPEVIAAQPGDELFGVLLQYPGASGEIRDLRPVIDAAHGRGALAAVAADLLALTLLMPPGELGADIAVGSTQRFGVPMGYGGPHAAYMSVRDELRRQLPGRLVGVSLDADGRPAYRLALQAREQHIRREKATSNICTAQVLLAVMAAMYAVYHGPGGLAGIAASVHRRAARLAATLRASGLDAPAAGSSTRSGCAWRAARPTPWPGPGRPATPCSWPTPTRSASPATRPPRTPSYSRWPRCWPAGSRAPRCRASSPTPARCSRPAWPGARGSSATRSSTSTAVRRPCCVTCAAWPTSISRWTAR